MSTSLDFRPLGLISYIGQIRAEGIVDERGNFISLDSENNQFIRLYIA